MSRKNQSLDLEDIERTIENADSMKYILVQHEKRLAKLEKGRGHGFVDPSSLIIVPPMDDKKLEKARKRK